MYFEDSKIKLGFKPKKVSFAKETHNKNVNFVNYFLVEDVDGSLNSHSSKN